MFKTAKLLKFILSLMLFLFSCEKVITVDIDNAPAQIVIDARITDEFKPHIFEISKSTSFYNPSVFPEVENAEIIINDDQGWVDTLAEIRPGYYQTMAFSAQSNRKYDITVSVDGERYRGSSEMPVAMEIDSIRFEKADKRPSEKGDFYELHLYFKNRPGVDDFALIKVFKNDKVLPNIYLFSDKYSDGKNIDYFFFGGSEIELKDRIVVELYSIDKNIFEYYDTLNDVIASTKGNGGPVGDVSPANPNTNLSNHALGYFSAATVRRDSAVVK